MTSWVQVMCDVGHKTAFSFTIPEKIFVSSSVRTEFDKNDQPVTITNQLSN